MIDEEAATAIEMEMAQQGPKRTVSVEDSAADIERGAPSEALPWYKQRRVILSLTGYASICFIYILIDELTPIFGSAAVKDGGLGFSTSQLAPPLAFSGVTLTIYALWGFPLYRKWLGTARTCRHGLIQTAPVAMLIPMASLPFLSSRGVMWLAMGIKSAAASNSFTSCMILVNESAPPGTLGSVNGVGQTLASAVRAVGPALGGFSWAWSLQLFKALGAPSTFGHQFLPFSIAAGVSLATVGVYAALEPKPSEPVELGPEGDEMR